MIINANTKIASVLKENTNALEAIVSLSPKFEKLRNPLLRKVMAPRTSLATASKMGGCTLDELYQKLEPLGFKADKQIKTNEEEEQTQVPHFVKLLAQIQVTELDVRPVIASGSDPLKLIMEEVKKVKPGEVLKIINTFQPTPLILMLQKKGFETYCDNISDNLSETYFYKKAANNTVEEEIEKQVSNDWESVLQQFKDKLQTIDVRHLQMPQPMLTILDALEHLAPGTALYVYHKRIPVFLLPELAEKGFEYRIKEIQDGEVHLLIFKQ
ncbi:DUF2249 domain-containing protein [Ilyomonas limi]|uniref:DUF2249 domain-containing protein n=1 Tax=Ilyomonas limi TaxID=2575867 RepID=A0A4U3L3E2_9BACT|nr:DUF2249 domain-containing protein [Ilyomonas limi]TKK68809.1 DUF2249 domain-containing protein [Ilyomonas limi]